MTDKYQYIRDEENEKLRKKLKKHKCQFFISCAILFFLACIYVYAIIHIDKILAIFDKI
jgi:Ca2+/Na+ antiporter